MSRKLEHSRDCIENIPTAHTNEVPGTSSFAISWNLDNVARLALVARLRIFHERFCVAQARSRLLSTPNVCVGIRALAYRGTNVASVPIIIYAITRTSTMAPPISNILFLSTATSSLSTTNLSPSLQPSHQRNAVFISQRAQQQTPRSASLWS